VSDDAIGRLHERLAVVEAQMLRVHADLVDLTKELRRANDERTKLLTQLAVLNEQLASLRTPAGKVTAISTGVAASAIAMVEMIRAYVTGR
jgi:septal ring factor EnvC (AmiA/AmiB activator)